MREAARRRPLREGGALISQVYHLSGRVFGSLLREQGIRNLNPAQWRIVYELWKEDGVTQTRLAERTKLDKSTLTLMLDRLEAQGHIARARHATDARARIVRLADKNPTARSRYEAASQEMVSRFYRGLSANEIDSFESTLRRIIKNLEEELGR